MANHFYRDRFFSVILALLIASLLVLVCIVVLLYQVTHRPLPQFYAAAPTNQRMTLVAHDGPNLLPSTLLQWASKAAVAGYTFDFANYGQEVAAARPYFTEKGWSDYQNSVAQLIQNIVAQKLFVYGVVSGAPVISNQGNLPGLGYAWRVQIPFLVVYQGADISSQYAYTVLMTIVKVPTTKNPTGVGIEQFLMVGGASA